MAKKTYYYVLVFTNSGPKYVTDILPHQYAEWDEEKAPMEMSKEKAVSIMTGLGLNLTLASVVMSPWKLETQPYNYKDFTVTFEEKKEEEQ